MFACLKIPKTNEQSESKEQILQLVRVRACPQQKKQKNGVALLKTQQEMDARRKRWLSFSVAGGMPSNSCGEPSEQGKH